MRYLLDTTETIAPGLGFAPFGPLHLGWLAAVAVGANLLLDTNFMFLMHPDVVGLLIWFEEHWGSHLYGLAAIMAVLLVVMNIPTAVLDAKEKKEETRV